jgi:hypothetical protein
MHGLSLVVVDQVDVVSAFLESKFIVNCATVTLKIPSRLRGGPKPGRFMSSALARSNGQDVYFLDVIGANAFGFPVPKSRLETLVSEALNHYDHMTSGRVNGLRQLSVRNRGVRRIAGWSLIRGSQQSRIGTDVRHSPLILWTEQVKRFALA